VQLPTPEQQLVDDVQGAPSPSATQLPVVGVAVGAGGLVAVAVGGGGFVDVAVGGGGLVAVAVGGGGLVGVAVGAGGEVGVGVGVAVGTVPESLNSQSDQPMRSWPYWFHTGFFPPVIVG